ncbi:MAG: hypothetical protein QGG73_02085 [Candidatus Hydrogenedentes bacterium]|jgi:hypothetical protein|nr:hypothetical protein [Candidatus Hydrogenedentota bacterium]
MRLLPVCAVCAILSGCGDSGKVLPIDELGTKQRQLDAIRGETDGPKLEKAIQSYQNVNGTFPKKLEDLVPDHLPSVPTKPDGTRYHYDPATGKVIN